MAACACVAAVVTVCMCASVNACMQLLIHAVALMQDALAMVAKLGLPSLFITITHNHNWPEVQRELQGAHITRMTCH